MNVGSIFTASKIKSLRDSVGPMLRAMRGGAEAIGATPGPAFVPIGQQLIETFVYTLVFSITMQILESSFAQLKRYQSMAVDMFPLTYDSPQTFPQDPDSGYEILEPSKDERNGTEFSYSCFISVQPDNFTGEKDTFKHVYHKGSKGVFPLMAPGVFFKSDTNTLRVYMNSSLAWNNYVDIPNIPLKKWFHLVVMVKGKALDVYINGNLANRHKFTDIPKINYGGFYVMLPKIVNKKTTTDEGQCGKGVESENNARAAAATAAAGDAASAALAALATGNIADATAALAAQSAAASAGLSAMQNVRSVTSITVTETERNLSQLPITINGRMNGFISRIKYFAFALSYAQIDKLVREGPNKKMFKPSAQSPLSDSSSIQVGFGLGTDVTKFSGPIYTPNSNAFDANLPGYQTDAWWTSGNQPHGSSETHQTGYGPQ